MRYRRPKRFASRLKVCCLAQRSDYLSDRQTAPASPPAAYVCTSAYSADVELQARCAPSKRAPTHHLLDCCPQLARILVVKSTNEDWSRHLPETVWTIPPLAELLNHISRIRAVLYLLQAHRAR